MYIDRRPPAGPIERQFLRFPGACGKAGQGTVALRGRFARLLWRPSAEVARSI